MSDPAMTIPFNSTSVPFSAVRACAIVTAVLPLGSPGSPTWLTSLSGSTFSSFGDATVHFQPPSGKNENDKSFSALAYSTPLAISPFGFIRYTTSPVLFKVILVSGRKNASACSLSTAVPAGIVNVVFVSVSDQPPISASSEPVLATSMNSNSSSEPSGAGNTSLSIIPSGNAVCSSGTLSAGKECEGGVIGGSTGFGITGTGLPRLKGGNVNGKFLGCVP